MFTHNSKNSLISLLESALEAVRKMPVEKSCYTCLYHDFGSKKPMCKKAEAIIPQEVLRKGCELYELDEQSPPF